MHTDEVPISTTAERQAVAAETGTAPDRDWVIVTRGIKRDYNMGGEVVHALRGVDIAIRRNEYVAIMGPSGAGKLSLGHVLGCLATPNCWGFWFSCVIVAWKGVKLISRLRESGYELECD